MMKIAEALPPVPSSLWDLVQQCGVTHVVGSFYRNLEGQDGATEKPWHYAPLKKALKKLRQNGALGIFPEGTRSHDGELKKPEPGIGMIAVKSKAPIIPVYISGTRKALPIGRKMFRPCKVTARIGRPIRIAEDQTSSGRRELYQRISERVMEAIGCLKAEAEEASGKTSVQRLETVEHVS